MRLCRAHGLPSVSLIDTRCFIGAPDLEAEEVVGHFSRMSSAAAPSRVQLFVVVLRKAYGLGEAMWVVEFQTCVSPLACPTGKFCAFGFAGAMGLGCLENLPPQS